MKLAMEMQRLSLLLLCGLFHFVHAKSVCTEEELNEAQRAFRNCVESAKAGIVSAHANEQDEQLVCYSLENMLAGCKDQVRASTYLPNNNTAKVAGTF